MKTKYFVDGEGNYIGGFAGSEPPVGSVEAPTPPEHANDKWDGSQWVKGEEPRDVKINKIRNALLTLPIEQKRKYKDSILPLVALYQQGERELLEESLLALEPVVSEAEMTKVIKDVKKFLGVN